MVGKSAGVTIGATVIGAIIAAIVVAIVIPNEPQIVTTPIIIDNGTEQILQKPHAKISGEKNILVNTKVQYNADKSEDSDGFIENYQWYVDGNLLSEKSFLEHTFTSLGTHEISLVVFDDDGQPGKETITVHVLEKPTECGSNEKLQNGECDQIILSEPRSGNPMSVELEYVFTINKDNFEKGEFNSPSDVAVDSTNNIFVTDTKISKIHRISPKDLSTISTGSTGTDTDQFKSLQRIAVDSNDKIYVVDYSLDKVNRYDSELKLEDSWAIIKDPKSNYGRYPKSVVIDSENFVYVAGVGGNSNIIQKYSNDGDYIDSFRAKQNPHYGTKDIDLGIDSIDRIYVVDELDEKIRIHDSKTFDEIANFGGKGTTKGQFSSIASLALDSRDFVYVLDGQEKNIHIFKETDDGEFEFVEKIKNPRGVDPIRIRIDTSDNMYIIASNSVYVYEIKY